VIEINPNIFIKTNLKIAVVFGIIHKQLQKQLEILFRNPELLKMKKKNVQLNHENVLIKTRMDKVFHTAVELLKRDPSNKFIKSYL
jgi:hypothetical protein